MKIVKKILYILFIIMCSTLIFGSLFIKKIYPNVLFEELYFYLVNGASKSDNSLIIMGLKYCLPLIFFLSVFLYIVLGNLYISKFLLSKIKKEKYTIILKIAFNTLLLTTSVYFCLKNLNALDYLKYQNTVSNFIESNYVDPKEANITFPENKRNLITIFVESLETSMFTKDQGGYWDYKVVDDLYKLLGEDDVVAFYGDNKTELMSQIDMSAWTTGGDVANTSGLPLKIPIQRSSYHSKNFMTGAYAIGDLLSDNGYYNEYISAARTSFGGISEYFYKHGDYKIVDINSYKTFGLTMEDKDSSKWGFNDNYLFEVAKKRLDVISKEDKPFNLAIQTIDTHYVEGYVNWYTTDEYETKYENVYASEAKLIYNFIKWLRKQDFYDNTTIVIVGDHISMNSDYFESRGATNRYIYNCYINSVSKPKKTKNRVYTSLDTYPTTLASLGISVKGNRLGLGTDLFSGKKTLSEKYGFEYFNDELNKKSVFYNKIILGKDYDAMNKKNISKN